MVTRTVCACGGDLGVKLRVRCVVAWVGGKAAIDLYMQSYRTRPFRSTSIARSKMHCPINVAPLLDWLDWRAHPGPSKQALAMVV